MMSTRLAKAVVPLYELALGLCTLYGLGLLLQKLEGNVLRQNFFRSTFEHLWNFYFLTVWKGNVFNFFIFGTNLWGFIVYWTIGGLYTIYDLVKPKILSQYRTQDKTDAPITMSTLLKVSYRVVWNQVFVGIPLALALWPFEQKYNYLSYDAKDLPSFETALKQIAAFVLSEEIFVYYSHRFFHTFPYLYKNFHKIHHEFTAPISITARYAHMLEDLLSNLWPVISGPIICQAHPFMFLTWILITISATLASHTGIHLPFMGSPEAHDYHHLKFNVNYGALGLLDLIHNTNEKFVQNVQGERHYTSFSMTPVSVTVPDRKSKKELD